MWKRGGFPPGAEGVKRGGGGGGEGNYKGPREKDPSQNFGGKGKDGTLPTGGERAAGPPEETGYCQDRSGGGKSKVHVAEEGSGGDWSLSRHYNA